MGLSPKNEKEISKVMAKINYQYSIADNEMSSYLNQSDQVIRDLFQEKNDLEIKLNKCKAENKSLKKLINKK